MVDKMKMDVDILLLVSMMEKEFLRFIYFVKLNFFPFLRPNVVYLRPFLTSLQFPEF